MARGRAALPGLAVAIAFAGCAVAARAQGTEPGPGIGPAKIKAIQAAVSTTMARFNIPGLTAAVVTDRQVRWSEGFGIADIENAVAAKPETVYRLASLSKPITATAILQLAERGRLDLDAPIQKYVPGFPEKAWPLTSRQLLAHLGGVRHLADDEWSSTRHYTSVVDALEIFKADALAQEPGTKSLYSTYGYSLLGAVVEGASGTKYLDYLEQNVFEPAGMEHATEDDVLDIIPNRAPGYVKAENGELRNSILADTSNKIPGGGLCATAGDIGRFAAALQAGTLLRKETLEKMFARQKTKDGKLTEYTLGWRVGQWRGQREAWHHGGQPRVSTLLYMLPDKGLAVVLLSNLEGVAPHLLDLARQVAGILLS